MDPKNAPFTEAYVKEQRSGLSLGYKLFSTIGVVVTAVAIVLLVLQVLRPSSNLVQGFIFLTLGAIYLMWAAFSKQRLNTFRENLELSRMIQQLREDK